MGALASRVLITGVSPAVRAASSKAGLPAGALKLLAPSADATTSYDDFAAHWQVRRALQEPTQGGRAGGKQAR